MLYALGRWGEVPVPGVPRRDDDGWYERLAGPFTNVHAAARGLGKYLVRSTPANPRSGYALVEFFLVEAKNLPNFGLPIPNELLEQANLPMEGE